MKVYLAGKITGDPNYREKFAEAAKKLAWLCLLLVREIEQFERKIRGDGR